MPRIYAQLASAWDNQDIVRYLITFSIRNPFTFGLSAFVGEKVTYN